MTAIEHVAPHAWRETVAQALLDGERFGGAWASGREGNLAWRALLASPHGQRVISCQASEGQVESIVDLVEAAGWDEREAHDLRGLGFPGHSPMRALAAHPAEPARWMTPVTGDGVHQVAVGPIHAGVIESGHFRFHVVGERILAVDLRLFYKHRGLERAAEGHDNERALLYAQRACGACAVANTLAYAHAVEDARGLRPDRELRVARTALLELERLYNHLHDVGAICAGVGFAPGSMAFAALKDRAQQINQRAFGHRFLFGSVRVGCGPVELDASSTDAARGALRELHADAAAAWRELEFAGSVQARLDGVGVLAHADAQRLGAVGPAARAAGIREDVRIASPRLAYDGFTPASPTAASGDVAARLRMRAIELETTCELLEDLLRQPLAPGATTGGDAAATLGVGTVESPRGATMCAVELDGARVARVHLRTGSYANWPALAHAAAGNLLPDFPLINKSFELCYACVDR
ncbi:MAG: NADH-quinone oxidoreductase subunit C [Solirubrobacteraceae bacterium]